MTRKTKNDTTLVEFVVRKNPKGITIEEHSDGTTKIIIEVSQDEMNIVANSTLDNFHNHGKSKSNLP